MGGKDRLPVTSDAAAIVSALVARARAAQAAFDGATQEEVDQVVTAAGWAIVDPEHNRALAELAVRDTGLGNVADKMAKNRRKTMGLLRDLAGAKSVGVIAEDEGSGLVEIARPVGVVGAVTPSTNPAATPANNIINALKGRNAIIVAPSPKGASTLSLLVTYIHAELDRVGVPRDLVQQLPAPVTRDATNELMRHVDLVVATGSQTNVRAAYASGTPAIGVGPGNVAVIVDETADLAGAADKIARSKMFDNATSCSSENSVVLVDAIAAPMLAALARHGCVPVEGEDRQRLESCMWPEGKLSPAVIGQSVAAIAERAGLADPAARCARVLLVEEKGVGPAHKFSGEKLSPVLTVYRARDFAEAKEIVRRIYGYQGAGHSVSLHSRIDERALDLGLTLPVARVIVNQVHVVANGGSFSNGLPVSLSMGCGTWGRNNFSENLNVRQYMNVTRIARPIPERVPTIDELLGAYFERRGR
jgi:sulfoacetaldehyde dehydrogenase